MLAKILQNFDIYWQNEKFHHIPVLKHSNFFQGIKFYYSDDFFGTDFMELDHRLILSIGIWNQFELTVIYRQQHPTGTKTPLQNWFFFCKKRAWILDVILIPLVSKVNLLVWLSNFAQCWLLSAGLNPVARIPWDFWN